MLSSVISKGISPLKPDHQPTMTTECCVCYSTTEDINAKYAASFITIPCGGKHVVCFPCFMKNTNQKCPMCRYDYVGQDDEEMHREDYEEHLWHEDHDYSYYQDLNREFNGNYQQAVDEAARIWKEFARLDQTAQDDIYEKLRGIKYYYVYRQLRDDIRGNEDGIIRLFDSSFDVCRVVYLSKIISQPDNQEAVEQLKRFEMWMDDELENCW